MKLKEITIQTFCLDAMKTFYCERLGLPANVDRQTSFTIRIGESVLTFQEHADADAGAVNPYYHLAFTVPTNKLAEAKQWLRERGIDLLKDDQGHDEFHFQSWNATSVYFDDPNGNIIEFIAHHTFHNAADEPFEAKHLLRISEIGLPVDQVSEAIATITDTFALELWKGDGKQFAAIGDAEGLFIVVDKQRPWFPDGRMPVVAAAQIAIQGGKSASLQLREGRYELINES